MRLKPRVKRLGRNGLVEVGRRLGDIKMQRIATVHGYLDLGRWSTSLGDLPHDYADRTELFAIARGRVNGTRPLYLEFGVFQGESLRWWSANLRAPGATLVGFDSFEGLPEDWNAALHKGAFNVDAIPQFNDTRVSLQIGWFDTTVPSFEVPDHDALIVNIDADLYSSAVLVLDRMRPHLRPGTLLYFDEFNDRDHELRALREFLADTGKTVKPLGSANGRSCWLFEVTS